MRHNYVLPKDVQLSPRLRQTDQELAQRLVPATLHARSEEHEGRSLARLDGCRPASGGHSVLWPREPTSRTRLGRRRRRRRRRHLRLARRPRGATVVVPHCSGQVGLPERGLPCEHEELHRDDNDLQPEAARACRYAHAARSLALQDAPLVAACMYVIPCGRCRGALTRGAASTQRGSTTRGPSGLR